MAWIERTRLRFESGQTRSRSGGIVVEQGDPALLRLDVSLNFPAQEIELPGMLWVFLLDTHGRSDLSEGLLWNFKESWGNVTSRARRAADTPDALVWQESRLVLPVRRQQTWEFDDIEIDTPDSGEMHLRAYVRYDPWTGYAEDVTRIRTVEVVPAG